MIQKYGYKGTETSINGIIEFMEKFNWKMNFNKYGTLQTKHNININHIIEYAELHIKNYTKFKDKNKEADWIAKHIDSNNLFIHFRDWYKDMVEKCIR